MRGSSPLATGLLAMLLAANAAAATEPTLHVRGLNAEGRNTIAAAAARSTIVETLIDDLQATDVVVYVTVEPLPDHRRSGYLSLLGPAGGVRYLMVRLDSTMHPRDLTAMLGHELQHAREVAAAPEVCDMKSLGRLYRRIGWQASAGKWESDMARKVEEEVLQELAGSRPATRDGVPGPPDSRSPGSHATAPR